MGLNDEKVKEILGTEAWEIIFESVTSGELVDPLKMREFAGKLHPTVGGAHRRRTGPPQRRDSDWTEMREVLSDWYQQELFDLDMERALGKFVKIFESNALMLPGLAGQIKKLMDNQGKG